MDIQIHLEWFPRCWGLRFFPKGCLIVDEELGGSLYRHTQLWFGFNLGPLLVRVTKTWYTQ